MSANARPRILGTSSPAVAISADGRHTLLYAQDRLGPPERPWRSVSGHLVALAAVHSGFWMLVADRGRHWLHRLEVDGESLAEPTPLDGLGSAVALHTARHGGRVALVRGDAKLLISELDGRVTVEALPGREPALLGARGLAERRGANVVLRDAVGAPPLVMPLDLGEAELLGGALLLDGSCVLLELLHRGSAVALVYELGSGLLRQRFRMGTARVAAVAERQGIVLIADGARLSRLDLRAGKGTAERVFETDIVACGMCNRGERLAIVDARGEYHQLEANLQPAKVPVPTPPCEPAAAAAVDQACKIEPLACEPMGEASPAPALAPDWEVLDEARSSLEDDGGDQPDALAAACRLSLLALDPVTPLRYLEDADLEDYLAAVRRWIGSLGHRLLRLGDAALEASSPECVAAVEQERAAMQDVLRWNVDGAPHLELARELGLSPWTSVLLLIVAAPQIWGELAELYGRCSADPRRPLVDELLLVQLLGLDTRERAQLAQALDEEAPLCKSGALELGRGHRPFAELSVHPAVVRRLVAPRPEAQAPACTSFTARASRTADTAALEHLTGPRDAIARLVRALARTHATAVRVALTGKAHSGRRTLAAALATHAGRPLSLISLPPACADFEDRVRRRLRTAALMGHLPCVLADELAGEASLVRRLRDVLDAHPGPLFVSAREEEHLPLPPGYLHLDLSSTTERERAAAWRSALRRFGLDPRPAPALAARFTAGPGAMARACSAIEPEEVALDDHAALESALAEQIRRHRSARLGAIASRVTELASWDDFVAPEEVLEGLREVCARVRHRHAVNEGWGMGRVAATARSVTALLQGGPGTGKTLAAGVVARALGYELWRVDLSKVVSKWIGETEKNLAAVFDAAEQGEVVLLFDEADSLFAKRTEVKTSNDRNANLETNYLLQRLDSFHGVAVLTTNFGATIDPAFKRRLTVHLRFPFPDELDRERLWRAHLPPTVPTRGELHLGELARQYPLSGGYIRNAALRAAYLAAAARRPLTAADLQRAVQLEYQRHGAIGQGRLE